MNKIKGVKHLLIVDSDEVTLELMSRFLENEGFEVKVAQSSRAALDQINDPNLAMVITEAELPHLSGFDLVSIMRKCQVNVPVVFLTGTRDQGVLHEAKHTGAARVLSKQVDFGNLPNIVRQILAHNPVATASRILRTS